MGEQGYLLVAGRKDRLEVLLEASQDRCNRQYQGNEMIGHVGWDEIVKGCQLRDREEPAPDGWNPIQGSQCGAGGLGIFAT